MRTLVIASVIAALLASCTGKPELKSNDSVQGPQKLMLYYPLDSVNAAGDSLYLTIPDHKLLTQTGDTFSLANVRGKVYAVNFFFADCRNICPKMNAQFTGVQNQFLNEDRVKLVSYTINPDADSVPVMAGYAERFKAVKDKWYFLTGSKKTIYDLARNDYKIAVAPGDGGPNDFIHSEQVVLIDPNLHIRGYYDGTDSTQMVEMEADIKQLLTEFSTVKK